MNDMKQSPSRKANKHLHRQNIPPRLLTDISHFPVPKWPFLSQLNLVHTFIFYSFVFKIQHNIIFPSNPGLPNGLFHLDFRSKLCSHFLHLSYVL